MSFLIGTNYVQQKYTKILVLKNKKICFRGEVLFILEIIEVANEVTNVNIYPSTTPPATISARVM
jgi:hypothetical protein